MRNFIVIFITLLALFPVIANSQSWRRTSFDDRPICEKSQGVWRQFGNSCGDGCYNKFDQFSICAQSIIFSCDCGDNKCWNGSECILKEEYKKIYDVQKMEEQKILDAAKEKRRPQAEANRRQIMKKIFVNLNPPEDKNGKKKGKNNKNNQNNSDPKPVDQFMRPIDNSNSNSQQVEIPPYFLKQQQQQLENQQQQQNSAPEGVPGLPQVPLP